MTERKTYQNLPADENPHFYEDGKMIFDLIKQKYPEENVEHYDNMLNGLCASLTIMLRKNVAADNRRAALQLIYSILLKNL